MFLKQSNYGLFLACYLLISQHCLHMFRAVKYSDADYAELSVVVKDLEQSFNRLSDINIQLRKDKSELGAQLKARTAEKAALEKEMLKIKTHANSTEQDLKFKLVSV